LKTQEAVAGGLRVPLHIKPSLKSFDEALAETSPVETARRDSADA
jgi:hypothetical protein